MQFNDIAHHAEASTSPVWQLLRRKRGKGRCFSLGSDTKAQVTLDISIGVDRHSAWFTKTNTDYYTSYWVNNGQGLNGFPRSARVDLAPR